MPKLLFTRKQSPRYSLNHLFIYSFCIYWAPTLYRALWAPEGAKTKKIQLLLTRKPPKQTFNVMGRAVREIQVITLWRQISGVHKTSQSKGGMPKDVPKRGLRDGFHKMTGEWHLKPWRAQWWAEQPHQVGTPVHWQVTCLWQLGIYPYSGVKV